MRDRRLSGESGSALVQVMVLSVFIMVLAYALSDFLGFHDNNSRKIIDRTVYMNTGTDTSEYLSDPNSSKDSQGVANDQAYP